MTRLIVIVQVAVQAVSATTALADGPPASRAGIFAAANNLDAVPPVVDWLKAPVGSFADYAVTGPMPYRLHAVLLARRGKRITIEIREDIFGGIVFQFVYDLARKPLDNPIRQVTQRSDIAPMEDETYRCPPYAPAGDFALVGKEDITVDGKTLAVRHLRRTVHGAAADFWVNDTAGPLGIVKDAGTEEHHELVRWGVETPTSAIVGRPRPFDMAGMRQMFHLRPGETAAPPRALAP